jgi:hypothetical protein
VLHLAKVQASHFKAAHRWPAAAIVAAAVDYAPAVAAGLLLCC